jgi:hypothetical protein
VFSHERGSPSGRGGAQRPARRGRAAHFHPKPSQLTSIRSQLTTLSPCICLSRSRALSLLNQVSSLSLSLKSSLSLSLQAEEAHNDPHAAAALLTSTIRTHLDSLRMPPESSGIPERVHFWEVPFCSNVVPGVAEGWRVHTGRGGAQRPARRGRAAHSHHSRG